MEPAHTTSERLGFPADGAALDGLRPALRRLDRRLAEAVLAAQSIYGLDAARDPYRGLYISAEEVTRLLKREPVEPILSPPAGDRPPAEADIPRWFAWLGRWLRRPPREAPAPSGEDVEPAPPLEHGYTPLERWDAPLEHTDVPLERRDAPLVADLAPDSPLAWLARTYGLSGFDLDVVLIALAPELDLRYERLYAYLQDDVSRRRPGVDLALNLLCASVEAKTAMRASFAPGAPLLESGLLHLTSARDEERLPPEHRDGPLLAHSIRLDGQVVRLLIGERTLDPRLVPLARLAAPVPTAIDPPDELLCAWVRGAWEEGRALRLYLQGRPGSGRRRLAEWMAAELDAPLLSIDLSLALEVDPRLDWLPGLIFREAWLHNALLYLDGWDVLRAESRTASLDRLWSALVRDKGITLLAGTLPWAPVAGLPGGVVAVSLPIPDYHGRRALWLKYLAEADVRLADPDLDALAARFRLSPGQIADALATAVNQAHLRAACQDNDPQAALVRLDDLFAAARAQTGHELAALTVKIEPLYTWKDIVLPEDSLAQLREICQRVSHRHRVLEEWGFGDKLSLGKGTAVLFAGPSGTGKSMAAEVLATELGLDLYKIDLSTVVSKYIGETEKNLEHIFQAARDSNAILFFDEADALFGKRSEVRDSHDRYANIEISYLLLKMESYDGVTILATNLRQNLDEAFVRRMAYTVAFPFPDAQSRRRIWEGIWPDGVPCDLSAEDLDGVAAQWKLSGGNIKNIALAATFFAAAGEGAVTMEHLVRAIRREYQKMGKTLTDAELQSRREQETGPERRSM